MNCYSMHVLLCLFIGLFQSISSQDKEGIISVHNKQNHHYVQNYSEILKLRSHHYSIAYDQLEHDYSLQVHHKPPLSVELEETCMKAKNETLWIQKLEAFVHSPSTKTVMYILCHDVRSMQKAIQFSLCYDWMHPILLKLSRYMDNQVYKYVFSRLKDYWKRKNIQFFITLPYKLLNVESMVGGNSEEKMKEYSLHRYSEYLQLVHQEKYDFLPLFRAKGGRQWILDGRNAHGNGFIPAWETLLRKMGYQSDQWNAVYKHPPFYKNTFIVRASVLQGLTDFMTYATNTIEFNSEVDELLGQEARYGVTTMTKEQLHQAFNTDHYCLYPFVMERLPIFYIYHSGVKVCDSSIPECSFTYR